LNTDIGKVQGQNQHDSWKNSRWPDGVIENRVAVAADRIVTFAHGPSY
jgi:hypothetical protein